MSADQDAANLLKTIVPDVTLDHDNEHERLTSAVQFLYRATGLVDAPTIPDELDPWTELGQAPDASGAIKARLAETGGRVWIPQGNYRLSSPLTRANMARVHVSGDGQGNTVFYPDPGVSAFEIEPASTWARDVHFRDFSVYGGLNGIHIKPSIYPVWGEFVNLEFLKQLQDGFSCESPVYASIFDNIAARECGRNGMRFASLAPAQSGQHGTVFRQINLSSNVQAALYAKHLHFSHFIVLRCESNQRAGAYLESCSTITIDNFYHEDNDKAGEGHADIVLHGTLDSNYRRNWHIAIRNPHAAGERPASQHHFLECTGGAETSKNVTYEGSLFSIKWPDGTITDVENSGHWGSWRDGVRLN